MSTPAPASLLAKMVQEGAVITIAEGFLRFIPYQAEILEANGHRGLFWINVGADDQSDAHLVMFRDLEVQNDRDIYLRDADRRPLAWVTPAMDTPELSTDDIREALVSFRQELSAPSATDAFQSFAASMRADALRAVEGP